MFRLKLDCKRQIKICRGNNPPYRIYSVRINYRRISLRHNLSISHSERNIYNGPIVATAISREKRKSMLERNGNWERHTRLS
jgi:hypothetical protein